MTIRIMIFFNIFAIFFRHIDKYIVLFYTVKNEKTQAFFVCLIKALHPGENNMSYKTLFTFTIIAVFFLSTCNNSIYAELSVDQIVQHFNEMNDEAGFRFDYSSSRYTTKASTQQVDISAYAPSKSGVTQGLNYFNSF